MMIDRYDVRRVRDSMVGRKIAPFALVLLGFTRVEARADGDATGAGPTGTGPTVTSVFTRVDCLHDFNVDKGDAQACLTVTSLGAGLTHRVSPGATARVRLDPFATPEVARSQSPARAGLPTADDTGLGVVDDYALVWSPRPNLDVSLESFEGAAQLPSVSGLAMAGAFAENGWKQTALTLTYNLATLQDMRVRFAMGNGEGETVRNLDPQQYFGFSASAYVSPSLKAVIGLSMDGNSVGSESYAFESRRYAANCGFDPSATGSKLGWSTQRLAAGLVLDGTLPGVEGLEAGLGWQRNVMGDLDKKRRSAPVKKDLDSCQQLDLDHLFVEDDGEETVNTVQRTVWALNLKYRLMERYFAALDYTTRRTDTGSVSAFEQCEGFSGTKCVVPGGSARNSLSQDAYTAGAGIQLAEGLSLTAEYHRASFDRRYAQAYYMGRDGKTSEVFEAFNARVAYDWR